MQNVNLDDFSGLLGTLSVVAKMAISETTGIKRDCLVETDEPTVFVYKNLTLTALPFVVRATPIGNPMEYKDLTAARENEWAELVRYQNYSHIQSLVEEYDG